MTFPDLKLLIFLSLFFAFGRQAATGQQLPLTFADSITSRQFLIAFKDTVFTQEDTLIIEKEVWVRSKDSLAILIDSLTFSTKQILFAQDTILTLRDTIVVIQDTVISRNERVLNQIKEYTERNTFIAKLLRNVLVFESSGSEQANPDQQSDKRYETYEGKIIRNIDITVLDVFGYSLNDFTKKPNSLLEKSGNFLHLRTQRWIVRNRLLFQKGDTINSLKISESERLLRDNNFIYDARIIVRDTLGGDSVDVQVITQDIWSITAGVSAESFEKFGLSLTDVNFLGIGHQVNGGFDIDPALPKGYNYRGYYTVNSLYNTLVTGNLYYLYEFGQTVYGGGLNRDFISPAIKWAGGANVRWNSLFYSLRDEKDSLISVQPVRFIQNDIWLGYGLNVFNQRSHKGTRVIFSGRMTRNKFYSDPIMPDTVSDTWYDNQVYFASVGLLSQRYYKDSYIFRLGRTEDIPEGYLISFTGGYELREAGNRPYVGLNTAWSRYVSSLGYFNAGISLGGFYNLNNWEQGVFKGQFLYFTPLLKSGRWKWRHYIGSRYTDMINPLKGEVITLIQEQGVRGLTSGALNGTRKLVLNYEANLFPPLNLLGFRMAIILFADFAWVSSGEKLISNEHFFPGYGAGIRFRNDHLIFNTLQLMLGYYPNGPDIGMNEFRGFERNKFYYNYYHFQFSRPSFLPY